MALSKKEEKEDSMEYEKYMRLAIEEAKISKEKGSTGYGAVIIKESSVIAKAHDTTNQTSDPTNHAEMNAIRAAAQELGSDLSGCRLICTCEPCPMCSSAAIWANIDTIVFGASIKDTLKLGRKRIDLPVNELNKKSPHKINVVEDILKEKCLKLYRKP